MYRIIVVSIIIIFYIYFIYIVNIDYFSNKQYNIDIRPSDSKYIEYLSIEYPIENSYLTHYIPIENTDVNNIYDYIIIRNFRDILERPPNTNEIKTFRFKLLTGEVDEIFLKTILYNSSEYEHMKSTQINSVSYELEFNTYTQMLYEIITKLHFNYNNETIYDNMLPNLKSIIIHFQFDMYLFIAVLSSEKYKNFELDILNTDIINKFILREIFYKHFILLEIHNTANAIKKEDLKNGKSSLFESIFDGQVLLNNKNREDSIRDIEELARLKILQNAKNNRCKPNTITKKIYNPINHNMPYNNNIAHNPPICTTLGEEINYKPSNELGVYTSIEESKKTQIGTIMPKFQYREYVEKTELI